MARLSRWAVFWRAFVIALLAGAPARAETADPRDRQDWLQAVEAGTPEAYIRYLRRHPTGLYIHGAIEALSALGALEGGSLVRGVTLY